MTKISKRMASLSDSLAAVRDAEARRDRALAALRAGQQDADAAIVAAKREAQAVRDAADERAGEIIAAATEAVRARMQPLSAERGTAIAELAKAVDEYQRRRRRLLQDLPDFEAADA